MEHAVSLVAYSASSFHHRQHRKPTQPQSRTFDLKTVPYPKPSCRKLAMGLSPLCADDDDKRPATRRFRIAGFAVLCIGTPKKESRGQGFTGVGGGLAIEGSEEGEVEDPSDAFSVRVEVPELVEIHGDAPLELTVGSVAFGSSEVGGDVSFGIRLENVNNITSLGGMIIPSIYQYIKRFMLLQPTMNISALMIGIVAMISSGFSPLKPFQLLWVNLIRDTLNDSAHTQAQISPLLSNIHVRNHCIQAAYQIVTLLTFFFTGKQVLRALGHGIHDDHDAVSDQKTINTIIFNAFVLCQLFDAINAREPERLNIFEGLLEDKGFIAGLGTACLIQVAMVEFMPGLASTVKLAWKYWVICTIAGFLTWPIALIGKFISVPIKPWLCRSATILGHGEQVEL